MWDQFIITCGDLDVSGALSGHLNGPSTDVEFQVVTKARIRRWVDSELNIHFFIFFLPRIRLLGQELPLTLLSVPEDITGL